MRVVLCVKNGFIYVRVLWELGLGFNGFGLDNRNKAKGKFFRGPLCFSREILVSIFTLFLFK